MGSKRTRTEIDPSTKDEISEGCSFARLKEYKSPLLFINKTSRNVILMKSIIDLFDRENVPHFKNDVR